MAFHLPQKKLKDSIVEIEVACLDSHFRVVSALPTNLSRHWFLVFKLLPGHRGAALRGYLWMRYRSPSFVSGIALYSLVLESHTP